MNAMKLRITDIGNQIMESAGMAKLRKIVENTRFDYIVSAKYQLLD